MNKYKICVYAICKNEEKFIDRWYNSMKEADEIYVLDTGSTDNTLNKLKEYNIKVKQEIITPFRFDIARNKALEMLPKDTNICISTDMDEVFEKGWRKLLEENYNNENKIKFTFNFSFDKNNNPTAFFYKDKIHDRNNYKWTYPVHETLKYIGKEQEKITLIEKITLNHYPDDNKSRASYLNLLKLNLKENPNDERSYHYLGREYMYNKEYNKAIKTLKKHISISNWKEEKSTSMRYIARCYSYKNDIENSLKWYKKSIKEAPHLKDPYIEESLLLYKLKEYNKIIYLLNIALDLKPNKNYPNEPFCYDHTIYDLLSLCYYYKNEKELAIYYINKAIEKNNSLERLKTNKKIFEK